MRLPCVPLQELFDFLVESGFTPSCPLEDMNSQYWHEVVDGFQLSCSTKRTVIISFHTNVRFRPEIKQRMNLRGLLNVLLSNGFEAVFDEHIEGYPRVLITGRVET